MTPAAPVLVPHAPVTDSKRLLRAVGAPFVRKRAAARIIAVLDPVAELLGRAAPHVAGQIRLGAETAAEPDELMSAEAVVFDVVSPVYVDRFRTPPLGPDPVAPVIIVGETAARPSQHGQSQLAEVVDGLFAIAVDIGNL